MKANVTLNVDDQSIFVDLLSLVKELPYDIKMALASFIIASLCHETGREVLDITAELAVGTEP